MRILIADDQPKVRFALRVLLERQPGREVIGEAVDAKDLLTKTASSDPDLVLLGWELPGFAERNLLTLREACPSLAVVVLSCRPEARQQALAAGADAFVSKADPPERLLVAIDNVDAHSANRSPSTSALNRSN